MQKLLEFDVDEQRLPCDRRLHSISEYAKYCSEFWRTFSNLDLCTQSVREQSKTKLTVTTLAVTTNSNCVAECLNKVKLICYWLYRKQTMRSIFFKEKKGIHTKTWGQWAEVYHNIRKPVKKRSSNRSVPKRDIKFQSPFKSCCCLSLLINSTPFSETFATCGGPYAVKCLT